MQTARICISTTVVFALLAFADQTAQAANAGVVRLRFSTEIECVRLIERESRHCLRWFAEAERRVSREAPRLTSRAACELRFGECRVRSADNAAFKGMIIFQPAISGIEVVMRGSRVASVEPLIGTLKTPQISAARNRKIAPQNMVAAAIRDDTKLVKPVSGQNEEIETKGPVPSYPVPRHRLPKRVVHAR